MRASYRKGVAWIAWNDEPEDLDPENVSGYISTSLLADLFGKDPLDVAKDVVRYRKQQGDVE
jgi:hypothetical protein